MENLKNRICKFENEESELKSFFRKICLYLLKKGDINKGKFNSSQKDEDIIYIKDFFIGISGEIVVYGDVWFGADVNDSFQVSKTEDEWNELLKQLNNGN